MVFVQGTVNFGDLEESVIGNDWSLMFLCSLESHHTAFFKQ